MANDPTGAKRRANGIFSVCKDIADGNIEGLAYRVGEGVVIVGEVAVSIKIGEVIGGLSNGSNKSNLPKSRKSLNNDLVSRGYECKGRTPGGYVEYKHPNGTKVWIRPDGEVITIKREWFPNGSKKIDVRYHWDGTPVTDYGHNTGEFVESIDKATFFPPLKGN
jgi:hypothetical protein